MASTKKPKSKKEEALAFLDDLDNYAPPPPAAAAAGSKDGPAADASSASKTKGGPGGPGGAGTGLSTPRASSSADRPKSSELTRSGDSPRKAVSGAGRPATPSGGGASAPGVNPTPDEDPAEALAFLEAQLATKRPARVATPVHAAREPAGPILSAPTAASRGPSMDAARNSGAGTPVNVPSSSGAPTTPTGGGGGGGWSFWSSASAAVAKARTVADEGYKLVREQAEVAREQASAATGGAGGGAGAVRAGLAEGLGQLGQLGAGVVKGVDLDKLRHDILTRGQSAITELINTVAPPISEHEVLQVWLAHEMVGYDGITGVVEAGVARIMEQTSSEDLEVIFLPCPKASAEATASDDKSGKPVTADTPAAASVTAPSTTSPRSSLDPGALLASAQALASQFTSAPFQSDEERSLRAVRGWEDGWARSRAGVDELVERARGDARRRGPDPSLPVTTIPLYMHIQPVLVPLPFAEPPISTARRDSSAAADATPSPSRSLNPPASAPADGSTGATASFADAAPHHLTFILSLADATHSLRFTTVTQHCPADWLEIEYDRSDWVEERLVGVLRTGVEGLLQEYVATRMGLKRSTYQPTAPAPFTPSSTQRSSGEGAPPGDAPDIASSRSVESA